MNYLREYSTVVLLKSSFAIYIDHFLKILPFLLVLLPGNMIFSYLHENGELGLASLTNFISSFVWIFTGAPLTVMLSEICLGVKPSLSRALKRVFKPHVLGRITVAVLLQILAITLGLVVFLVGMIVASVWYIFTIQVVIVEDVAAISALKRSRSLTKGQFWRIFGILASLFLIVFFVGTLLPLLSEIFLTDIALHVRGFGGAVLISLMQPWISISLILLYYDLRVRKEGYDLASLTQDIS